MAENLLKMSEIVPKTSDKVLQNNRNIKICFESLKLLSFVLMIIMMIVYIKTFRTGRLNLIFLSQIKNQYIPMA